jgi:hypothetical protein
MEPGKLNSMANVKCPHCGRDFVRRVPRTGFAEVLLSLFYVYPFKCQLCGERFRAFQRGIRYVRVNEDRREYDRMEMKFPVTVSGENVSGEGTMLNFSMAGCSFTTSADLAIGMIVKVGLQISPTAPPTMVEAGVVRYVGSGRVGVEFLRWQESERARAQLFVRGMIGTGSRSG